MNEVLQRTLPPERPTLEQLAYCRDNPDQLCVADFDNFRRTFVTVDTDVASRIGQPFEVLSKRGATPIYHIRFADGGEIDAYSAEVCERVNYDKNTPDPSKFGWN